MSRIAALFTDSTSGCLSLDQSSVHTTIDLSFMRHSYKQTQQKKPKLTIKLRVASFSKC